MPDLPAGTVTFLLTDIEGSTRLWEAHPKEMATALARHDALATKIICQYEGMLVKSRGEGDSLFAVFERAYDAVLAACALQQAFIQQSRPSETPLRVRMALHTGETEEREGDYYGPAVNRCARLRSIAHGGQVLLSLATEELVRDHLPESCSLRDLASHRLKDLQQPEHVFQLMHPCLPSEFAPLRSLQTFATNLPVQPSSFVGREREMQAVKRLLDTTRLLSLTGTGGCGKTRLALQVAADLVEAYSDGVWLVELAALSDASLVVPTVASVLGVREEPGRPLLETLTDYLRLRSLLLLLDNCEHLVEACAQLADTLLRACPTLKLLVTSREPLHTPGEKVWRVPSLLLPDLEALPLEEKELGTALLEYDAVVLFVERARAQRPDFHLTRQEAAQVASICHRLDGIPLAIELAAARVRAMSLEQIAARLEDRFHLLTGGARTELARHQTLLATLDWSYDLLSEPERELLRRLSVFAGGWTLEAAEQVCGGEGMQAGDILDLLTSLVDKSLVVYDAQEGKERYRLLETVRIYSRERLAKTEEGDWLRARHLGFYLALAEQAEKRLTGSEQWKWLNILETEHDNLREALRFVGSRAEEAGADGQAALRLSGALQQFWRTHGHLSEGREWLTAALGHAGAKERTQARAKALHGAGALTWLQGEYAAARIWYEQSLSICREIGDQPGIVEALKGLGTVAHIERDYTTARTYLEESLSIARGIGDRHGVAAALNNLGLVTFDQGDDAAARAYYEQCLSIVREAGDRNGIAIALNNLGNVTYDQGDYAAARAYHEQSLAIEREIGDPQGMAVSLNNMGGLARFEGDFAAARAYFAESLAIRRQLGDRYGIASALANLGMVALDQREYTAAQAYNEESLAVRRELGDREGIAGSLTNLGNVALEEGEYAIATAYHKESLSIRHEIGDRRGIAISLEESFASLAAAQEQPERAACLWGAGQRLRKEVGALATPKEKEHLDSGKAKAREALGEKAFTAAWEKGRAMTMEQAVAFALQG